MPVADLIGPNTSQPLASMDKTLSVLVLAYSISPIRGSEYSVGWNHVQSLSKHCRLTVLYGLAGPHMGDTKEIEDITATRLNNPNIEFVAVSPNLLSRALNFPNRVGLFPYSFYFAYRFWHKTAAKTAKSLMNANEFDLIHYLCPIGYREPGYLWKLGLPYIWGPISGMSPMKWPQGAPRPYTARLRTNVKHILNQIQLKTSARLKRALLVADVVVAATTENQRIIESKFLVQAKYLPENGIPDHSIAGSPQRGINPTKELRLIWIGSFNYRKSPDIIIESLLHLKNLGWHLDMVGDGPLKNSIRKVVSDRGLAQNVTIHGSLPRDKVQSLIASCDIHVLTSTYEANTTVLWEAMASGVPTIAFDHSGMHDTICEDCGIKLRAGNFHDMSAALTATIERLLVRRHEIAALQHGLARCRQKHLVSRRAGQWLELYQETIRLRGEKTEDGNQK